MNQSCVGQFPATFPCNCSEGIACKCFFTFLARLYSHKKFNPSPSHPPPSHREKKEKNRSKKITKNNKHHFSAFSAVAHVVFPLVLIIHGIDRARFYFKQMQAVIKIHHMDMFFLLYIFWHAQIMKNHIFCYNFSCVNVCEIGIRHLLHLFIRIYNAPLFILKI